MSQASKLLMIKEMVESADASLHSAKMILEELTGEQSKKSYTKIAEKLPDLSGEKDEEKREGGFC